jgi:hypothetical protein
MELEYKTLKENLSCPEGDNYEEACISKEDFLLKTLLAESSLEIALKKCKEMSENDDITFGIIFYTELLYRLGKKQNNPALINKAQDNFASLMITFPSLWENCKTIEDLRYFENLV